MKALATLWGTFFGIGFFPFAPGTAATAAGIVLAFFLKFDSVVYLSATVVLLVVSVPVCTYIEKAVGKKDPGILVIDEVVGVLIALIGLPLSWPVVMCGFFLFRALDMFKIYPINRLESLPGGFGIMLDDVMAGLYTNLALHLAVKYAGLI